VRTSGEMRGFLAVPGPIVGAGLPGLIWRAVAFSAGGGGGRGPPELPTTTYRSFVTADKVFLDHQRSVK